MQTQVFPQTSLQQIVDRILTSRRITRVDQHLLLAQGNLSFEEQALIDLVFDRLRRGLLKVVD